MAAKIGLGTVVAYESVTPGTYTTVGEVFDFSGTSTSMDTVDATDFSHTDGHRRFLAGLIDAGEITFTLNFDPALTVYGTIDTFYKARTAKNWKFSYAGSTVNTIVSALVTGIGRAVPMDDKMTMEVSLKVSGVMTEAAS